MQYKFSDAPKEGIHTIEAGYARLVIVNQVAEVNEANADEMKLAEQYGGRPVVANVVEKKSAKKATETDRKK